MKPALYLLAGLVVGFLAGLFVPQVLHPVPRTYADCILQDLPRASSSMATRALVMACQLKFGKTSGRDQP